MAIPKVQLSLRLTKQWIKLKEGVNYPLTHISLRFIYFLQKKVGIFSFDIGCYRLMIELKVFLVNFKSDPSNHVTLVIMSKV